MDRIDAMLADLVDNYRRGNHDAAAEIAADAYLDHYEGLEADLERVAPKVNADLEPLLSTELRAQIKADTSTRNILRLVARAHQLIRKAREALAAT